MRETRKKIAVILPDLTEGGAQNVFLNIFSTLAERHEIHLIVLLRGRQDFKFDLGAFHVHRLESSRTIASIKKLYLCLRQIQPDAVFSTLYHVNFIAFLVCQFLANKPHLIVREGNTASVQLKGAKKLLPRLLIRLVYPRCRRVLCLSRHMLEDLHKNFGVPLNKMKVIYNPAKKTPIPDASPYVNFGPGPHILAVGRLNYQKDYPYLLDKFSELLKRKPGAHLWILGTGGLLKSLQNQAESLGIREQVHFEGFQSNTAAYYGHTDLFVMSSHFEGTPNVLMEALAFGCPLLIKRHPGGTEEVMKSLGVSDRLVDELNWEERFFEPLPEYLPQRLDEQFSLKNIAAQYEALI